MKKSTLFVQNFDGIPCLVPNVVTQQNKEYYVSYNNRDIGIYGSDTTALVVKPQLNFYILNGDHRHAYSQLKTLEDCKKYFLDNNHLKNRLSEDLGD